MVRFVILKGFGPLDHKMGPWRTKDKVLLEKVSVWVKLRPTVGGYIGHTQKCIGS